MRLEQERGDDAEVAAAAANGPEQVAVLLGLATTKLPSASTTSAASRLSMVRPYLRVRCPMPPPSVSPPTPVVEMMPDGTASPNACVA